MNKLMLPRLSLKGVSPMTVIESVVFVAFFAFTAFVVWVFNRD